MLSEHVRLRKAWRGPVWESTGYVFGVLMHIPINFSSTGMLHGGVCLLERVCAFEWWRVEIVLALQSQCAEWYRAGAGGGVGPGGASAEVDMVRILQYTCVRTFNLASAQRAHYTKV
jgi:hypothetical protein